MAIADSLNEAGVALGRQDWNEARALYADALAAEETPEALEGFEAEVLALVAEGLSNRQIAERLVVSEHTVHRHVSNIYQGLGVSSRAQAVAVATERGPLD